MNKKKPKIGAHISIAGGIQNAPGRAHAQNCEVFQCFTRSPQGGPAPLLTPDIVHAFQDQMRQHQIQTFYIHTPYYINLASLKNQVRGASIRVIREELERGSILGASYVMTHVGSHTDQTIQEGTEKVIQAIRQILDGYRGETKLLIEISAGAGNVIGDTFQEIGDIIGDIGDNQGFGGICFDTCHAFASGYDFTTPQKAQEMLNEFDKKIGLSRLKLTHVNDSKGLLGGKKDRHEHVGDGHIGIAGLSALLQTSPFLSIDWILETADDKRADDVKNLRKIRGF